MNSNLHFEPDYYKITKIVDSTILEVNETWLIKLRGVDDNTTKPDELKKWLKKGNIVRVIPRSRNNKAQVISDVWLGNIHVNRQFSNYKTAN